MSLENRLVMDQNAHYLNELEYQTKQADFLVMDIKS